MRYFDTPSVRARFLKMYSKMKIIAIIITALLPATVKFDQVVLVMAVGDRTIIAVWMATSHRKLLGKFLPTRERVTAISEAIVKMNQYVFIESTSAEKTLWPETEAAPEIMAKVHPMKTSDSIARTITEAMTIDLPETAL